MVRTIDELMSEKPSTLRPLEFAEGMKANLSGHLKDYFDVETFLQLISPPFIYLDPSKTWRENIKPLGDPKAFADSLGSPRP